MIIGVEHQSSLDKNMIIRILNYDAQLYINQVESGKEVRPVGSFVFYTGDKEWTYPKSLKESLKIPPEMEKYINDWKLPVLELQKMDPQILKSRRLKEVVEISQSMLEGDYEKLRTNRIRIISQRDYRLLIQIFRACKIEMPILHISGISRTDNITSKCKKRHQRIIISGINSPVNPKMIILCTKLKRIQQSNQ